MADSLPAPRVIKVSLLENMGLAHVNAVRAYYITREYIAQKKG